MVIKITNKCNMNCSHCMEDSTIDSQHMTKKIFNDSVTFLKQLKFNQLLISGGEPTMHPNLFEYIDILKKNLKNQLFICSNGSFLNNKKYIERLRSENIPIQITNDFKYYPKKIDASHLSYPFKFANKIIGDIIPLGRAKNLKNIKFRYNPLCYNFRSVFKTNGNFITTLATLEILFSKNCTSAIDSEGKIYISECSNCKPVGTIYDSFDKINKTITNFKCNQCGLYNNLDIRHRDRVGE